MTSTYVAPAASSPTADAALLIGRIALVVLFIMSGVAKFSDIAGTAGYIASKGLPVPTALAVLAGIGEVVGGLLIVIG